MRVVDRFRVRGHQNITARNKTTFEYTKESHLSPRGDCIIGVGSDKGAMDLAAEFKALARKASAVIRVEMVVGKERFVVVGRGSPGLSFSSPTDLVGRKSVYACGRTFMVGADKAARDMPRELVSALKNPNEQVEVALIVEI